MNPKLVFWIKNNNGAKRSNMLSLWKSLISTYIYIVTYTFMLISFFLQTTQMKTTTKLAKTCAKLPTTSQEKRAEAVIQRCSLK